MGMAVVPERYTWLPAALASKKTSTTFTNPNGCVLAPESYKGLPLAC